MTKVSQLGKLHFLKHRTGLCPAGRTRQKYRQKWIQRAGEKRLDRVDFSDGHASREVIVNRTDPEVEAYILETHRIYGRIFK